MVAATLARLRTMPASASSRAVSASPNAATRSGSNPANAARNASRLRRIVSHDSPDWNASRREPLEDQPVAVDRAAPLVVVVLPVLRGLRTPVAADDAVLAADQVRGGHGVAGAVGSGGPGSSARSGRSGPGGCSGGSGDAAAPA